MTLIAVEEEFDWSADFDRNCTAVSSVARLLDAQRMFDEFGIRPALALTYPVATQSSASSVIRSLVESGKAEVGAHLHPWVTPPHEEELSYFNSYPGNLPKALEREKLQRLRDAIVDSIGVAPTFYHAGRYGIGPNTPAVLDDLGFDIDLSSAPPLDCSADGGPDFSRLGSSVRWFGTRRRMLAIPTTGAFVGGWRWRPDVLYRLLRHRSIEWTRLGAVAARVGLIERLRLSPEDYAQSDHRRLTRALLDRGQRIFTFYFHSPTLKPGCTDYTRTEDDVNRFLDSCRAYYRYFRDEIGGEFASPMEVRERILAQVTPRPAGSAVTPAPV